jgi:DNA-binding NarL/FixJ family response regulator
MPGTHSGGSASARPSLERGIPVEFRAVFDLDEAGNCGEKDCGLRVLIADDHPLVLEGLRTVLDDIDGIEVVAEASTGGQVLPFIARTNPDLVVLDIRMPELDGFACLDRIRAQFPKTKVVILSAFNDSDRIEAALRRGACGYIVKSVGALDLPAVLRQAVSGNVFHAVVPSEASSAKAAGLTEKEMEILKAVARGLSNQAIGKELWVTEQTIKHHLTNIYRKLGVANRTEAVRYAFEHGLAEQAF